MKKLINKIRIDEDHRRLARLLSTDENILAVCVGSDGYVYIVDKNDTDAMGARGRTFSVIFILRPLTEEMCYCLFPCVLPSKGSVIDLTDSDIAKYDDHGNIFKDGCPGLCFGQCEPKNCWVYGCGRNI